MRIATLNIRHGGGTRVSAILRYLPTLDADVLILTEFRSGATGSAIRSNLAAQGYSLQAHSSNDPSVNAVLMASRIGGSVVKVRAGPPGFEHCLTVARFRDLSICACYFPQGERKRPVFDQLIGLTKELQPLGLVLGDLNTGLPFQDEAGRTFKCVDAFQALLRANLVDSWRVRHPDAREFSWRSTHGNGFRIDHALATGGFNGQISTVEYDHTSRELGITDHSALLVASDG